MNIWFDFETRAGSAAPDLRRNGAYRYATHADALVLAYAIDNGPVHVVATGQPLAWGDLPELHDIFDQATFIAWNASFDRAVWNYALLDSPFLAPEKVRDAMAVALVNNLPPDLERASVVLTGRGKQADGKRLIAKFCAADSAPPDPHDGDWQKFRSYASLDVIQLREVCRRMRPLPDEEWAVYAANEAINDRGIPIDLIFAEKAARLAARDTARTNRRLNEITNGAITSVYQHERIASWAYNRLEDPAARDILVSYLADPEQDELETDEEETEPTIVLSARRMNVVRLLDYLHQNGDPDPLLREVLELREFGAGASPKKFAAMLEQHVDGRLHGQIVFNGAGMTGRFSGKGTQPQNMTRATLGTDPSDDYGTWEAPTIDLIADGCDLETLAAHGAGEPPAKKLALLVRPAVMAPIGKTLVKADYAQIEARMLPFLAGGSVDDMPILQAFAAADADPTAPDLYRVTAAMMLNIRPADVSKEDRQAGKIAVLACGYQGGKAAMISFATNYGLYLTDAEAQHMVDLWRRANSWAPKFWGKHNRDESYGLIGAAMRAVNAPRVAQRAGRIVFAFLPDYLGGSLLMRLPSGRIITYPWCKVRDYEVKDKQTGTVVDQRRGLTFRRPNGLSPLYGGRFAENATQAAAADLLRDSLVELDGVLPVIMHAHDEIVVEVEEERATAAAAMLRFTMERERPWTKGLPLAVDTVERFYYSAAKRKETVDHVIQGSATRLSATNGNDALRIGWH